MAGPLLDINRPARNPLADINQRAARNPLLDGNQLAVPRRAGPPRAAGKPPAKPPAPAGPSPLDSTYWQNVNQNQFRTNNQVNQLALAQGQAGTALQGALAQLSYQQPRAQLGLEQRANARGALFSTPYDQQLADLNYQYAGKQGGLVGRYGTQMFSDASRIAGLEGSVPLFDQQQALAASTRAAAAAQRNPAVGSGQGIPAAPNVPAPRPAAAPRRAVRPQNPLADINQRAVPRPPLLDVNRRARVPNVKGRVY